MLVDTDAILSMHRSVVTPMAGFAGARRPHPGRHTTTPADFRYVLAVSLRTPVTCSMRRKGHPSFPSAMTCCFFSSLKTLLMPTEPIRAPVGVNVQGLPMAGFQLTLHGRIWVTPEDRLGEFGVVLISKTLPGIPNC
jgi:hypothetical protein